MGCDTQDILPPFCNEILFYLDYLLILFHVDCGVALGLL
jgi:hypothetical protein